MPWRRRGLCARPGCPEQAEMQGLCHRHLSETRERHDQDRGTAAERGYDSAWNRRAKAFLSRHRWCDDCGAPSKVPDHYPLDRRTLVESGVEDPDDEMFLVPRCIACHNRRTVLARMQATGAPRGSRPK